MTQVHNRSVNTQLAPARPVGLGLQKKVAPLNPQQLYVQAQQAAQQQTQQTLQSIVQELAWIDWAVGFIQTQFNTAYVWGAVPSGSVGSPAVPMTPANAAQQYATDATTAGSNWANDPSWAVVQNDLSDAISRLGSGSGGASSTFIWESDTNNKTTPHQGLTYWSTDLSAIRALLDQLKSVRASLGNANATDITTLQSWIDARNTFITAQVKAATSWMAGNTSLSQWAADLSALAANSTAATDQAAQTDLQAAGALLANAAATFLWEWDSSNTTGPSESLSFWKNELGQIRALLVELQTDLTGAPPAPPAPAPAPGGQVSAPAGAITPTTTPAATGMTTGQIAAVAVGVVAAGGLATWAIMRARKPHAGGKRTRR